MKQGSNMTRSHKGMRKGISLMELLIAIILLGVISSVGYNYYRNYYDTSLASKQAKVSILIEQANQLKNALELYKVKFGGDVNASVADPADLNNGLGLLVTQRIITEIPQPMLEVSNKGWFVENNVSISAVSGGTNELDLILVYDMNGTTTTTTDRLDYCNALNNIASNGTQAFTVTTTNLAGYDQNASQALVNNSYFCWDVNQNADADGLQFLFVAKYY